MTVSVIVPIYNVEQYVERCLTSVFRQTYGDLDIILVDDCSTDRSLDIARETIEKFPQRKHQTQVIALQTNGGSARARTAGMKAATGDYMIQIDSDDYIADNYIERLARPIIDNPKAQIDMTYTGFSYDFGDKIEPKVIKNAPSQAQDMLVQVLEGTMHSSLCTKLLRHDLIKQYGLYPAQNCNLLDDKTVIVKFLYYAHIVESVPGYDYYYNRVSAGSITSGRKRQSANKEYVLDSRRFFQDKTLNERLETALHHERVALFGHYLLYAPTLDNTEYESLLGVHSLKHIFDHPTIPWYYKIVVAARVVGFSLLVNLVRKFMA